MFESPLESQRKSSQSRWIKIGGVLACIFVIIFGITFYVSKHRASEVTQRSNLEPYRAGSPEFDAYSRFIQLEQQEHRAAENMLRQVQVAVNAILFNNGDRTLTAIEVRAVVYDARAEEAAERIVQIVPRSSLPQLRPGESMWVQVVVNNVPAGVTPAAAKVFLHGLRIKEAAP